jgi:hypothetical protein
VLDRKILGKHGVLAWLTFLVRNRPRYIAYKGNGYVHEIEEYIAVYDRV